MLEVTTSYLQGKYRVEIRVQSVNKDNSHSWVTTSHGLHKLVTDLSNNKDDDNEQETCEMKNSPIGRRNWIDIEPGKYSFSDYEISKKVTYLLRHSQQVQREEDGAVHFWRIKEHLQKQLPHSPHWSDGRWKVCFAAGGGDKRRFQYCTDSSGTICLFPSSSWTFRTQSY